MTTDYDALYRTTPDALGPPTAGLARFLASALSPPARVLDLGCGQGRDAVFLARLGHSVTGVDSAPAGIAALNAAAAREGLDLTGIVADVTTYAPAGTVDLLLFDRVLHMLAAPDRAAVLARLAPALAPGGLIAIVDEPRHRAGYMATLAPLGPWDVLENARGNLTLRRG